MDRRRSSSAARRPSRIRRSWPKALTGLPFELVDQNGAPAGEKFVVFYNPPVVNRALGIRRSYLNETRRIARELIDRGQQTLVFANGRLATEVLLTYLKDEHPGTSSSIRGYRGGYLPKERREIERKLRDGDIRAVVATNALELGIDIGSLDAVVMAGYPGTIASTWQRAGRAGRRQTSCAGGAGGVERAARSIHHRASGIFLRPAAGARAHQSGQSGDPDQSPEVRGVRAADARW